LARPASCLLALALGFALTIALASCGGSDAKLLSGKTAREITENLETVKQLAAEGECVDAENAAQQVSIQVEGLEGVDPKLRQGLVAGAERLNEVVAGCTEESTEETIEEAPPPETTPKPEKAKKPKPEKEEPGPPEKTESEAPEESEGPPFGKAKGHSEPEPAEETPSGGIGPGTEAGGGPEGEGGQN
jgi:outer membrane biosynthesis protein TonB